MSRTPRLRVVRISADPVARHEAVEAAAGIAARAAFAGRRHGVPKPAATRHSSGDVIGLAKPVCTAYPEPDPVPPGHPFPHPSDTGYRIDGDGLVLTHYLHRFELPSISGTCS